MSTPGAKEELSRPGIMSDVEPELIDNLSVLAASGEQGMVLNILANLHPADIARLLARLPIEEGQQVFRWLPIEPAGEVLAELDDEFRAELLEETQPHRLTALLDELDSDDAADILADLPVEIARQVLPTLEDAEEVEGLLGYHEESAGGIMAAEFVAVPGSWTVAETTEEVRRNADEVEDLYSVFVLDEDHRLKGFVSLKRLLLSKATALMSDIMDPEVLSVPTDIDQEEVARIMERYDLVSLPVVDAEGRIAGRITIDDVVDVIREEAEEDIQRMSGVAGGEEHTDSVLRIIGGRLPWLLMGLCGAGFSAFVINFFSYELQHAVILASFIPIVMATAGNAGIQSSSIAVQGLASGDVWASDVLQRLYKELRVALLNGTIVALVLGAVILTLSAFFPERIADAANLAYTAGLALIIVIVLAASIGATIPLLLHRVNIDPAIATGPFITTSNDILGILIFFLLAKLLYL